LHGMAWYGVAWHRGHDVEWYGNGLHCIACMALHYMSWCGIAWHGLLYWSYMNSWTLLLRFTFWGASSKSDYLVLFCTTGGLDAANKKRKLSTIKLLNVRVTSNLTLCLNGVFNLVDIGLKWLGC
jgi:hypothetical protein